MLDRELEVEETEDEELDILGLLDELLELTEEEEVSEAENDEELTDCELKLKLSEVKQAVGRLRLPKENLLLTRCRSGFSSTTQFLSFLI